MTCREFAAVIADYLTGEMADEVRQLFTTHLDLCENCRRYLSGYEQTIKLGRQAFEDDAVALPDDVPEELVRAVLAARRRIDS